MELVDPELSRVMGEAVESRIRHERENPLTPIEYLEWLSSMSGLFPDAPLMPMKGSAFKL